MANLLIGYSQIGFSSSSELSTPTMASGYSARNLYGGGRVETVRASAAATTSTWSWDHGATVQPEYIFLARADLLRRADSAATTWTVDGSSSSGFGTVDTKTGTFNLGDLKGPRSEDLISTFTYSSAYRYWRFKMTTTASVVHEYSKLFLGNWLDLGRDPLYPARFSVDPAVPMPRAAALTFDLAWTGISDATISSFVDKVLKYRDANPVILYDAGDLVFSGSVRVIHAIITDAEITAEWPGTNRLELGFREVI